jgi:hypothetical protein
VGAHIINCIYIGRTSFGRSLNELVLEQQFKWKRAGQHKLDEEQPLIDLSDSVPSASDKPAVSHIFELPPLPIPRQIWLLVERCRATGLHQVRRRRKTGRVRTCRRALAIRHSALVNKTLLFYEIIWTHICRRVNSVRYLHCLCNIIFRRCSYEYAYWLMFHCIVAFP